MMEYKHLLYIGFVVWVIGTILDYILTTHNIFRSAIYSLVVILIVCSIVYWIFYFLIWLSERERKN